MYLLTIFFSFFGFLHCSEKSIGQEKHVKAYAQPVEWNGKLKLSDHLEDFEILTVKDNDRILLSKILRLQVYDNRTYIKCWQRAFIFIFDQHLNHIINIKPTGSGPLEFSNLTDYYIDYPNQALYVLDGILGKVVEYDLKTFEPIDELILNNLNPVGFTKVDGQFIFITNDFEEGIVKICDIKTNECLSSQITEPKSVNMINSLNPFFYFQNHLLMGLSFSDTIYQYDGKRFISFATVGKAETSIASLDFQDLYSELLETRIFSEKTKKTYIPVGYNSSFGNLILVPLGLHYGSATIIINPDLKKSIFIHKKNIGDFHLFFYEGLLILDKDEKGYYYSYVMPNPKFYESVEKIIYEQKTTKLALYLSEFIKEFPEENSGENPFVIKFKMKPNALEKALFIEKN